MFKRALLLELEKCLPFRYDQVSGVKGWNKLGLKEGCADLPFIEISNISSLFVQNFIKN